MSSSPEHPLIARVYDAIPSHQGRPDVGFYTQLAGESSGTVLELGSGTGRVLIPIAQSGKAVYGLEESEHMLSKCQEILDGGPQEVRDNIRLVQGRMQCFDLEARFSLVICPFNSFLHLLSVEEQLSCLICVHHHLAPDGRFVFDVFEPDIRRMTSPAFTDESQPHGFELSDGTRVDLRHRNKSVDFLNQIMDSEITLDVTYQDGRQERVSHPIPQRFLFRYEAEHLLERCGFEVEALYSDFQRSPHGATYPGPLVFMARKR